MSSAQPEFHVAMTLTGASDIEHTLEGEVLLAWN